MSNLDWFATPGPPTGNSKETVFEAPERWHVLAKYASGRGQGRSAYGEPWHLCVVLWSAGTESYTRRRHQRQRDDLAEVACLQQALALHFFAPEGAYAALGGDRLVAAREQFFFV